MPTRRQRFDQIRGTFSFSLAKVNQDRTSQPPSDAARRSTMQPAERMLFGGESALLQLSDAYARCLGTDREPELVLISGSAGVGKTSLASSLQNRVSVDHGFFLRGKFDELLASSNDSAVNTYGPFVEAFSEYCNRITEAGHDVVASLKILLKASMTPSELLVIQDTIPSMGKILGTITDRCQKTRISLRGADAEERFIQIICKLLETISSQGYPIVLLLDDVQWSTPTSRALLRAAATVGKETPDCHLLVVCTCRKDNVELFKKTSQRLQSEEFFVTTVELTALTQDAVQQLVANALGGTSENPILVRMIFDSTRGNPFHILQLLDELQQRNVLFPVQGEFKWKANETKGFDHSVSVANLIRNKLTRLPDKAIAILKVAACIGSAFTEECLKAGVVFPSSDTVCAIQCCQTNGILDIGYDATIIRFAHDEFRRAAYLMIPKDDRNAFHLDVGRRLWHLLPKEHLNENLFFVADQLSHATRLIQDDDERDKVARLFLQAGQKAAQTSSFALAAQYLHYGIALLRSNHWEKQYKLSLALHNTAAEIEYFCGNLAQVDVLVDKILKSAKSYEDTLVARFTRIYCLGSRHEMAKALEEGFEVLKRLGERFSHLFANIQLKWDLYSCRRTLHCKGQQEVLDLPRLTDAKKLTSLRLMNILHSVALLSSNKCAPLLAARATRLTLQYGLNDVSCAGFSNLALLYAMQGNVDESYCCSQLAQNVFEKYRGTEWHGRLSFSVYAFAFPLKRPLRESIPHLLEGHQAGLVSGDISFSMLCAFMHCRVRLCAGDPIVEVLNKTKSYRSLATKYCQHFCISHFDTLIQFCLTLMGEAEDPLTVTGEGINEDEVLTFWETKSMITFLGVLVAKHFMAVCMNDLALASRLASVMRSKHAETKLVPFLWHNHLFYQAVTSATLSASSIAHKHQALSILSIFRSSAHHCPANYLHRVYLIEAELASASGGCHNDALAKYELSIALAKEQGLLQEQALACEKAGRALQTTTRSSTSTQEVVRYLEQARSLYAEWGAHVKVHQLDIELAGIKASCQLEP